MADALAGDDRDPAQPRHRIHRECSMTSPMTTDPAKTPAGGKVVQRVGAPGHPNSDQPVCGTVLRGNGHVCALLPDAFR